MKKINIYNPQASTILRGLRVLLLLLTTTSLLAVEHITNFQSTVTIHEDGSMHVREDITVQVEGRQVRRGIVREFPTTYKDRLGNWYTVGFDLHAVRMDGKPTAYFIETASNGKKINFGDESFLTHGLHTFSVEYSTNRQLGFFEDHDELYWNVTGSGWRLPIAHASARVQLPESIPSDTMRAEAYTGGYGSREKHVVIEKIPHGMFFKTTRPLLTYEGLTIVVGWPKGYITQPSLLQEWNWFLADNAPVVIVCIAWLILMAYFILKAIRIRRKRLKTPIIPLFYPPEGMLPGGMRYYMKMKYDSTVLAADVVNMAVHQWLTISYKQGMIWGGTYTLNRAEQKDEPFYQSIASALFKKNISITIGDSNNNAVESAIAISQAYYHKKYGSFFDSHIKDLSWGLLIVFLIAIAIVLFAGVGAIDVHWVIWWILGTSIPLAFIFIAIKGYTLEGMRLRNEIEGFKLFLATTETDRLKVIGTPPTRTPELYETYLPYAMALGVEKQWSAQFAPLFEELRVAGTPYAPLWIVGWDGGMFRASHFASNMSSSMSSAISSSASRPGSSSGFSGGSGGGGFSGGGGGGGGGGGR